MIIESHFNIGQKVEFTDESDQRIQGTIFAITIAEVGPSTVGFWYKLFLQDQTEVEIEEAGSYIEPAE